MAFTARHTGYRKLFTGAVSDADTQTHRRNEGIRKAAEEEG